MSHALQDKVVLITGASAGIGAACAELFAKAGARVVIAARREEHLKTLADKIKNSGGVCSYRVTDVTKRVEVELLIEAVVQEYGRLDILINNAGVGCVGHVAQVDIDRVRQVFELNVFGALHCMQVAVAQMKKQGSGHIMNVSSIIGRRSVPEIGAYCATKFALNALSDALRLEVHDKKIAVTTICPGLTETDFAESQLRPRNSKPYRTKFRGQSAEHVAKGMLKAARKKTREVHFSGGGKFLLLMERLCPWFVDRILSLRNLMTGYF